MAGKGPAHQQFHPPLPPNPCSPAPHPPPLPRAGLIHPSVHSTRMCLLLPSGPSPSHRNGVCPQAHHDVAKQCAMNPVHPDKARPLQRGRSRDGPGLLTWPPCPAVPAGKASSSDSAPWNLLPPVTAMTRAPAHPAVGALRTRGTPEEDPLPARRGRCHARAEDGLQGKGV